MAAKKEIKSVDSKKMATATATATADTLKECNICCETFNKSNRLCVDCEYGNCQHSACVACVRAYLLTSTNEPHCMECKQPWTPKFTLILTKKWLTDIYKPHRQKFLCEIELSKLAESMTAAENYKLSKKEEAVRAELREQERVLRNQMNELNRKIGESLTREHAYRRSGIPGSEPEPEKKIFFMSCPSTTCNGMLSTQYKCGICDLYTCPDCHEIIGANKATAEHTCDPNNVASAQAIKKETKQCPGCHNRIYKTEGCSQMWCTGCHTAFDWNTGKKVISGQLHNPHWLEYQRTQNKGNAPRAPGDVPCGGICTRADFNRIVRRLDPNYEQRYGRTQSKEHELYGTLIENLRSIYGFVVEVTLNKVRELREQCQQMRDYGLQRIKFIVGEITKEQMSIYIYRNDRARQKNTELLHLYELLSVVGVDMFNRLLDPGLPSENFDALIIDQIAEYNKLRLHCNSLFSVISNTYNQCVPKIRSNWSIISKKYNSKTMGCVEEKEKEGAAEGAAQGAAAGSVKV